MQGWFGRLGLATSVFLAMFWAGAPLAADQPPALQLTADEAASLPLDQLSARLLGPLGATIVDVHRPVAGQPYFELTLFTAPRRTLGMCETDAIVMAFNDARHITPGGLQWIRADARYANGKPETVESRPGLLQQVLHCDVSAGMAQRYFAASDAQTAEWLAGARDRYATELSRPGRPSFPYACEDSVRGEASCARGREIIAAAPLAHAGIAEMECGTPVGVRRPDYCQRLLFPDSEETCAGGWGLEIAGNNPQTGAPMEIEWMRVQRVHPCWSHTTRLP